MVFSQLDDDIKEEFLNYELPVEVIKSKEDSIIYDMFARVNTNNMTLNKQELRNAKYWGEFKVFIYNISAEYRDMFIEFKMFTDKQFSRMLDIEYISSLVIGIMEGVVSETPTKIDLVYSKYDEVFEEREEVEYRFKKIINVINELIDSDMYSTTFFKRKAYFYTLFMALNHLIFGDNNIDVNKCNKFTYENIEENISELRNNLIKFESKYDRFMNNDIYNKDDVVRLRIFEKNHTSRTTNQKERLNRVTLLLEELINNEC